MTTERTLNQLDAADMPATAYRIARRLLDRNEDPESAKQDDFPGLNSDIPL